MPRPEKLRSNHLVAATNALAPPRGRRRSVDRDTVIETALRIVDEEHLGALTMRRLAEELGVGIATVYAAAGDKEEILNAVVELILSEAPIVSVDPGRWEAEIIDLLCAIHDVFVNHPDVAHLALLRRITGPIALRTQETILLLLRAGGLEGDALTTAYTSLTSYVMGFSMLRISRIDEGRKVEDALGEHPTNEFPEVRAFAPELARQMSTDGFLEGLRHLVHSFA
ncbi:regulatory protein TetR [Mycolicibacterium rhodesiae JS60]|nr:regulatory protein TetR [Mycolicibacterium rhodesiae JS60]